MTKPNQLQHDLESIANARVRKADGIPGLVCNFVDKTGASLFEYAGGERGCGTNKPMNTDTIFWFASCTKLITSIAAMQLVEKGQISLDDGEQLETLLWELKDVRVLVADSDGNLSFVNKKRKITLRMLLSHTAGFGYSFSNPKIKKWSEPAGILEVSSREEDIFSQPLVNQPGEQWEYGVNMDWVGRLVERISGQSLGDYMRQHIFEPMEITSLTFHPTSGQKQNLAYMHKRNTDGTIGIHDSGHLLQGRLLDNDASAKAVIDAGGHGLFGTPKDYAQVISVLLNHGTYHKTGTQILQESTVKDMLKNQIPEHPDFARNLGYPCKPSLVNFQLETYPQASDHGQGWGLSFFSLLHPSHTGRSAGTIWWSGLANLVWWADVEKGVGGIVASQILPFFDTDVFGCHDELETAFYKHLARRKCES